MNQPNADLAAYYDQQVEWSAPDPALGGARRAALRVPLDYRRPGDRDIEIGIARHEATGRRRGVLMIGPGDDLGNSGLNLLAALLGSLPGELVEAFDVVGFDHRFMGASTPIYCDLEPSERFWVFHYPESFDAEIRYQATVAAKCSAGSLDLLAHANSRNICRDMDVIRGVLAADRIDYLGYSYGTYLGAVYGEMFGDRLNRAVLDAICSPDWVWRGLFTDFPENGERALNRWCRWAATRHATYGLGSTGPDVRAAYDGVLAAVDRGDQVTLMGFPLDRTLARLIPVGMLNSEKAYPVLAGIVRHLITGADLDADSVDFLTRMFGQPKEESGTVAQLAILAGDASWPRSPALYEQDMLKAAEEFPWTGAALNGIKAPAFWPVPPSEPATRLGTEAGGGRYLLVAADEDMSTPWVAARRMHEVLGDRSSFVTVADTAHHRVFPFYGNAGLNALVSDFLLTGRTPGPDHVCPNPDRLLEPLASGRE
ncbi:MULTISPECIES: alpha/beta fold hydrolase [unclassified Nonomuraea]|uniref:alpha/beta fold hydrolase n=1 Tax=unclassified Nonomuraea TaxID=2593643 RepID=UPI0033E0E7F8